MGLITPCHTFHNCLGYKLCWQPPCCVSPLVPVSAHYSGWHKFVWRLIAEDVNDSWRRQHKQKPNPRYHVTSRGERVRHVRGRVKWKWDSVLNNQDENTDGWWRVNWGWVRDKARSYLGQQIKWIEVWRELKMRMLVVWCWCCWCPAVWCEAVIRYFYTDLWLIRQLDTETQHQPQQ